MQSSKLQSLVKTARTFSFQHRPHLEVAARKLWSQFPKTCALPKHHNWGQLSCFSSAKNHFWLAIVALFLFHLVGDWSETRCARSPALQKRQQTFLSKRSQCSIRSAAMSAPETAPVGEWISPITSQSIVSQSIRLGSPRLAADGFVYWNEGRPTEGGRQVLVRR